MTSNPHRWIGAACMLLGTTFAGCGGGEFSELFVKLITARFVPPTVALAQGTTTRRVELEITCDRAGLDTPFGRLGVEVRLDPEHRLPAGVQATVVGPGADPQTGLSLHPCNEATTNPELRLGRVMVDLALDAEVLGSFTLVAYVQVEPLVSGEPSKDSTTAELVVSVTAPPSTPSIGAENGITPL